MSLSVNEFYSSGFGKQRDCCVLMRLYDLYIAFHAKWGSLWPNFSGNGKKKRGKEVKIDEKVNESEREDKQKREGKRGGWRDRKPERGSPEGEWNDTLNWIKANRKFHYVCRMYWSTRLFGCVLTFRAANNELKCHSTECMGNFYFLLYLFNH